jgi:hypothetical protein
VSRSTAPITCCHSSLSRVLQRQDLQARTVGVGGIGAGNGLWMDPLAGLVVAGLAVHEGRKAWTSGDLCAC